MIQTAVALAGKQTDQQGTANVCLQRAFISVSRYVKDIKIHQDFP